MDKKADKLRFVGYSIKSKGYRLLDEKTSKILIRRGVIFNETNFCQLKETGNDSVDLRKSSDDSETCEPERHEYPQRQRHVPIRYGIDEYVGTAVEALGDTLTPEPSTLEEALSCDHATEWKAAADSEYQSLVDNDTWELVELPPNRKAIGCKWVFKVKCGSNGIVDPYKGCLVAKEYAQKYEVDYDETFSPVVRFSSIRTLLAFAVQNDMLVHQMDVVTAFLNGKLEDEIYMEQPEDYVQPGKEHLICKLKKSLYGLKQSPRCWNTTFTEFLESIKFKQNDADPCVFIRAEGKDVTIVAVYVDDLIIITQGPDKMKEVKESLMAHFKMKDSGKIHYCFGISIEYDDSNKCIWMHQKQYILSMIKKFGLAQAKTVATPACVSVQLKKDDGVSKEVNSTLYQSMVGSLLYAAIATRPDIAQAVGVVSKFCSKPSEAHLTAVKRIPEVPKGNSKYFTQV